MRDVTVWAVSWSLFAAAGCGLLLERESGQGDARDAGPSIATDAGSPPDDAARDASPIVRVDAHVVPLDAAMPSADAGSRPDGGPCPACGPGEVCFTFPSGASACVGAMIPRTPCRPGTEPLCDCARDADCGPGRVCVDRAYGHCGGPVLEGTTCVVSDCAACSDGELCVPPGAWGGVTHACAAGPCRSNADCERGGSCELHTFECGPVVVTACRYAGDCRGDGDCAATERCVPASDGLGFFCAPYRPPR